MTNIFGGKHEKKGIKDHILYNPESAILWHNLGVYLHCEGRVQNAIQSYRHAINIKNGHFKEAETNLAQDLLLYGEWKEGFRLYENRLEKMMDNFSIYRQIYGEPWKGFDDKRDFDELVIISEQGLGDTIQFIRLIDRLRTKGIKVVLFCQEQLKGLLEESTSICKITTTLNCGNIKRLWCPLMSLMHRLDYLPKDIDKKPYIMANKKRVNNWKNIIKKKKDLLVGLHWQGNKKFERKMYSRNRSIGGLEMSKLGNFENIEYLALQKGEARKDKYVNDSLDFVQGQEAFDRTYDFRDTCAVIELCDVVISSDSCIVHLAGAMGKPTYILLNNVPEWRWGIGDNEVKWYMNMETFRQEKRDQWDKVVNNVRRRLVG